MPVEKTSERQMSALFRTDPARIERRERRRFRLTFPIRLLRDGRRIGDSSTREMNCEGFSCILPGHPNTFTCGEVLECEIDLLTPPLQLRCQVLVMRSNEIASGSAEVVCRVLGYQLG